MTKDDLTPRFQKLRRQLDRLPETTEPPPTTLQLLGRNRQEGDWQRYLAYFLTPDAPHGIDHAIVEQFLVGLTERDDIDFAFSRFDLDEIQVATEVPIPDGRLDLIVWSGEEWFVFCELKLDSTEGDGQTRKYAQAESFGNLEIDPTDIPDGRRHYLYITPDGTAPESDTFIPVEWSWIATQLRTVRASDYSSYPARTTGQLDDFIDTIETELTMTDYEQNESAKAELYVDHYNDIATVKQAFENEWSDLIDTWGRQLAAAIDGAEIVEAANGHPPVAEDDVLLTIPDGDGSHRYWLCRQGNGNWAWLFPTDWWTDLEANEPIFRNESPNARVGFLHRPSEDRDTVLRDHELTFYLRNAPSGNDEFYPLFAERFNSSEAVGNALPENTERPGRKSNVLEVTYDIDSNERDGIFEGYLAALATAVDEHIVSNPALMNEIDEIYMETLDEVLERRT